ncbi:MAG: hypothetical protein NW215_00745 [Hyphomicrobiales bacterium]|nr:hypothetical protein [Hyphomicrobiales bacterium]
MLWNIPWIVLPFIVYNLIALAFGTDALNATVGDFTLLSTAVWTLRVGDAMIAFTLVMLFVEIMKASRHSAISLVDHGLSMLLFVVCLIEFLAAPIAATSVFFVILAVALIDVMAGFVISIRFARRDLSLGAETA